MDAQKFSTPVDLKSVTVEDFFWKNELELVRTEVIPYQWKALNDKVEGAAPSFCMRNYKVAGKLTKERMQYGPTYKSGGEMPFMWGGVPEDPANPGDKFYGFVFQDSDFSKWIEAVGYSLTQHPDPELEKVADEAIDIVCAAQQENGYLDTYYIISDLTKAFTNLRDCHELYCFGHLTEGAVAYYQATGKDKLLKAAMKYADYISTCFGPEFGKKKGYPGHEMAEMALARLYEATGDRKYLDLSKFFIDERGKKPYYFDLEDRSRVKKGEEDKERYAYHQAHKPVREQDEVTGHAVRAVYLYSGMADVARLTQDDSLLEACERLWDNLTGKKMYITGGIGSTHVGEAFSYNYDLPNDTAYSETCAAIGLVFFARRMLEIRADRKYSDVMERALFNGVLSGMALDGKSFFYVNPLEVNPEACRKDERKAHVKPIRQKWFGCACCPPNIARLLSSVASYAFTENESTLFVHLYMGGTVVKKYNDVPVKFKIESGFPWNGNVTISCENDVPVTGTIALRLPGWCKNPPVIEGATVDSGYAYITREWKDGDSIDLNFEMDVRLMVANSRVREDFGKLAVSRGPLVYCLEEADNGKSLHMLAIAPEGRPIVSEFKALSIPMNCIRFRGVRYEKTPEAAGLYTDYSGPLTGRPAELVFIPYFAWNNRGEGEMTVWVNKIKF